VLRAVQRAGRRISRPGRSGPHCLRLLVCLVAALLLAPLAPAPAQAAGTYTVTATLDGRTAKSMTNHAAPNKYPKGSQVTVVC